MTNLIENLIMPILLLLTSLFQLIISLIVFISFIKSTELRNGIYGTILICIFCEITFTLNSLKTSITILSGHITKEDLICTCEAIFSLFFVLLWLTENTSIMILFFLRKLESNKLCNLLHLISFLFSLIITIYMLINNSLGVSEINSCFISKEANYSIIFLTVLVLLVLVVCISYNFWFYRLRNSTKDRSFINDYNYFIFFTCFLNGIYFVNLTLEYTIDNNEEKAFYFICIITNIILSIYVGIFRIRMEYISLFFSDEKGEGKYKNILKFLVFKYTLPKFKEIKKRLNVKFIKNIDDNSNDMIYKHLSGLNEL
jgi:hypothetical protein